MIRRPPRPTLDRSSAASDVYKRQLIGREFLRQVIHPLPVEGLDGGVAHQLVIGLIADPLRPGVGRQRLEVRHDESADELAAVADHDELVDDCLLYPSPSPRDRTRTRMPSSA